MTVFSSQTIYEETEAQRSCYLNSWLGTKPGAGLDAEGKAEVRPSALPSGAPRGEAKACVKETALQGKIPSTAGAATEARAAERALERKSHHLELGSKGPFLHRQAWSRRREAVAAQAGGSR